MRRALLPLLLVVAVAAGCGGGSKSSGPTTQTATPTATSTPAATATNGASPGVGALQAEANATAAGDIPDNQVFLVYRNSAAGYSLEYPEGWAQSGSGANVFIRDKNNIVRVIVETGPTPTTVTVKRQLASLGGATIVKPPAAVKLPAGPAMKVVYSTISAPNPVTGKRLTLMVDRYYIAGKPGKHAVVELGSPVGVDNVDAYRMMVESFRWR